MKLKNRSWKRVGWILLPQIAVILAIGLGSSLSALSQAVPRASALPEDPDSPLARRRFIGLPDVSSFGVQNLLGIPAQVEVTTARSNGTVVEEISVTIPPESVRFYNSTADLAYIASDQQIFGANFELSEKGNDAYLGLELSETTSTLSPAIFTYNLYLPEIMKMNDGWTAAFALQNESEFATATVWVGFYDQSGTPVYSQVDDIPARGTLPFNLADMENIFNGFSGSAIIVSDQGVAVARVRLYNEVRGLRSAYPGVPPFELGETLIASALFNDKDGQTSQVCVQNANDNTQNVTINYSDGLNVSAAINPNATHCFNQGNEGHIAGWQGGAIISSNSLLAAVVNVTSYENDLPTGHWSYTTPATWGVGKAISLPLIFTHFEGNGGEWNSDIYLYNFGKFPSVVTPRYSFRPDDFIYCGEPLTIPAGQMRSISLAELPPLFGPGMAYFSSTQPVAAVSGVTDKMAMSSGRDRFFGYEAAYPEDPISFPDSCDTIYEVFLPAVLGAN